MSFVSVSDAAWAETYRSRLRRQRDREVKARFKHIKHTFSTNWHPTDRKCECGDECLQVRVVLSEDDEYYLCPHRYFVRWHWMWLRGVTPIKPDADLHTKLCQK